MIKALRITGKVEEKSWLAFSVTLAGTDPKEAAERAGTIYDITPEHKLTIVPLQVYPSTEKLTAKDYPYGRHRTEAYFSVEFNKKGFRTIFQTLSPTNHVLNKPQKGTYYKAILPVIEELTGHCGYCGYLDFNGTQCINRGLHFMHDFYSLFTKEQIRHIANTAQVGIIVDAQALIAYCGADKEVVKALVDKQIKTMAEIEQTGENRFLECLLDRKALDATKVEGYNPFVVTSH